MKPIPIVLMTILLSLYVHHGLGYTCFQERCFCSDDETRTSCIHAKIQSIEELCTETDHVLFDLHGSCDKTTTLILRRNNIVSVDMKVVLGFLPRLRVLDLRDQTSTLCSDSTDGYIRGVRVLVSNRCSNSPSDRPITDGENAESAPASTHSPGPTQQSVTTTTTSYTTVVNVIIGSTISSVSNLIVKTDDALALKILKVL